MPTDHQYEPNDLWCSGSNKVGKHNYCRKCSYCIVEGCGCYQAHELPILFTREHTQKTKGIMALSKLSLPYVEVLPYHIIQTSENISKIFASIYYKSTFARPCPSTPRHGFLESRLVTTEVEVVTMLDEVLRLDPNGELLLMRYINASHNMVWTPGLLTIGLGNDGATSGKDAITVPTAQTLPFIHQDEGKATKILQDVGITDAPYLEFVVKSIQHAIYITQLRDGPKLEYSKDYIPKQVKVTKVLNANDYPDLLQWETTIHEASKEVGTVVYHRGGALSSHYGVHCKINEVTYMTSFSPKIGQTLEPTNSVRHGLDASLVLDGIAEGLVLRLDRDRYAQYAVFTLACLHNLAYFTKDESRYVGIAIAILLRLGIAACKGESRRNIHGKIGKDIQGLNRDQVYEKVLNDFQKGIRRLGYTEYTFRNGKWDMKMGGAAWADCTKANIELFNLVITLYRSLGEENQEDEFRKLLEAYNKNINQAHNNGWYLNKYVNEDWFNYASKSGSLPAIHCGSLFYDLRTPGGEKADLSKFKPIRLITNKIKRLRSVDKDTNNVDNSNKEGSDSNE